MEKIKIQISINRNSPVTPLLRDNHFLDFGICLYINKDTYFKVNVSVFLQKQNFTIHHVLYIKCL